MTNDELNVNEELTSAEGVSEEPTKEVKQAQTLQSQSSLNFVSIKSQQNLKQVSLRNVNDKT